ncbi:MAG: LytR/AlgR family response regulator transcription factor [Longimicrobiaceae bacterium]
MSPPVRAVIVDDEPLARERLRSLLAERPGYALVAECPDGEAAVAVVGRERPDLVFLDVEMPGLDGFGVLEALGDDAPPHVVFVTAYDRYAVRAFDVRALDYLLKPIQRPRFDEALARLEARRERGGTPEGGTPEEWAAIQDLLRELRARRGYPSRLVVRSGAQVAFVPTAEVEWIEADGNYARIHARGRDYLLRETMKAIEARLDPDRFVRIHRSAIVNVERISTVEPYFHGEYVVTLAGGRRLIASRTHAPRLRDFLR